MKRLSFIAIIIVSAAVAFAQKVDPQVLLKQASEKAAAYQTIAAGFTYSLQNTAAKLNDSQKGDITIKGDKYRLEIAQQTILSDGKTVYTIMPNAKEVQINDIEDMNDAITPNKIFTDYYKNFTAKSVTEKTVKGVVCQVIELEPVSKKDFTKAVLTVAKSDLIPQELQLTDKKGTLHTYVLENFKVDQPIDDAVFTFKQGDYPDYEVIDMR
ncbi:MAG: outer membrane lipoprotein carrier protein LolA [Bacteroidales bacterium]|nr:outer membrane lipoprotein carrier protein LolA [Bacteroidales bacterium]